MKLVRHQILRAVTHHLEARPQVAAFDLVLDGETITVTDPTPKEEKSNDKSKPKPRRQRQNGKRDGATES